jgi:hypothetical protein
MTGKTAFYTIVGEKITFFSQDSLPHGVQALWFSHLNDIYTEGPHSFHYDGVAWENIWVGKEVGGYGFDMTANNHNDILVCGALCTIRHYSGEDWQQWRRLPGIESASFNGCTMRGDDAWVVGTLTEGTEVLIVKGTRSR